MRGEGTDLYALSTLTANDDHGTCIEIMHIFVIFFRKSFIYSLAEFTHQVWVDLVLSISSCLLWDINKLVTRIEILAISWLGLLGDLRFNRLLIEVLRLFIVSFFLKFFFDGFENGWAQIFKVGLE
jgi:hypothetical protein